MLKKDWDQVENSSFRKSLTGKINRANGALFESWITASCAYYEEKGMACIVKTPEPMKPIKSLGQGRFVACFTKKGQPDYKGVLCDGTGIMFEAKHTDSDRINQNVITDAQWEILDIYERFGAHCYVMVSLRLAKFYRIPWKIWKQMKELFGHKFMTEQELESYRLPERQCTILILEGVGLKDEDTENRAGTEAE